MNLNYYTRNVGILGVFAAMLLCFNFASAQNVLYHEEFDGGLGDWTTVGYEAQNAPDYDYENNVWTWDDDGVPNSNYRVTALQSETVGNGNAVLDGVGYQQAENGGGFPDGPPYPFIHAELISPVYDISSVDKVSLQWQQVVAELNESDNLPRASYSVKVDGGEWTAPTALPGLEANRSPANETMNFYINPADDASTLQVKFIYAMDFYYWMIDDVKIIEAETFSDLYVNDVFVTPARYTQPEVAIAYDTFYFEFTVGQKGTVLNTNATMTVRVKNKDTGDVLHTDSKTLAPIPLNVASRRDSFVNLWAPEGLTPGTYVVEYEINDDEYTDTDPDNNLVSYEFVVSDNLFSMDNGITGRPLTPADNSGNGFDIGMLYQMPKGVSGEYKWTKVYTAYDTIGVFDMQDHAFTLYFSKIADQAVCDNLSLFNTSGEGPSSNEQFQTLGSTFFFLSDYNEEEVFDIPLLDIATGDPLSDEERKIENGACYTFFMNVPTEAAGAGMATSYRPYSVDIEQSGGWRPTVYDPVRATYFTGGWDGSRVPILRAEFSTFINSTEEPLPANSLKIYPNPATDVVTADIDLDNPTDVTVVIADMQGVVKSISVEKNVTQTTIQKNISDLAAGTYIFRIVTKDGAKNTKFIKQ